MNLGTGPGSMSTASSSGAWKAGDVVPDQFPAGLRVLVVDDDPTCLMILEKMLRTCLYEVTKCNRAETALSMLRGNKSGFDIVISDVHMPDMDGFKLLEHIGLEMDLPVIMMSADDGKNVVMKGVTHGACDYLIKPVRIEALKNIWQHVVRKRKNEWKDLEQSGSVDDGDRQQKPSEDVDYSSSANEGNWKNSKRRKDEEDDAEERDDSSTLKKPRVVWSVELHQQFVAAVNQLGIDKAVPKKILELMNVPGLTRENVASHLQKYRLYLRRLSGVSQHQNGLNNSFMGAQEAAYGTMSSLNGIDLQTLAVAGHLPAQSLATLQAAGLGRSTAKSGIPMPLVDQRNLFSFEAPKFRYGEGQQQQQQQQQLSNSSKQMNLLHGIPTNMEPKQLATLRQSAQSFGGINMQVNAHGSETNPLLMQMTQPPSRTQMLNDPTGNHVSRIASAMGQPVLPNGVPGGLLTRNVIVENGRGGAGFNPVSQNPSVVEFPMNHTPELPGNSFPLGTNPGIPNIQSKGLLEEVNSEMKGSRGFAPSYDIFNDLHQPKPQDWELQNVGMTFNASEHLNPIRQNLGMSPSLLAHHSFSTRQKNGQTMNAPSVSKAMFSVGTGNEHGNTHNINQNLNTTVKMEKIHDPSCDITPFPQHYGQDDLMSALFKQQESVGPVEGEFDFDGYTMDNIPV